MDIGSIIKKRRNEIGLTQVQLASNANISRSYLADVEKNRYNASVDTLKAIARALKVPMSVLLGENSFSIDLICALHSAYHNKSHDGITELKFWEFISEKLSIDYEEISSVASDRSLEYSIQTQLKLIEDFKEVDNDQYLKFAEDRFIPVKQDKGIDDRLIKSKKIVPILGVIPSEFTNPNEARSFVESFTIFGSDGFEPDKLDDKEIIEFANALLEQMDMMKYKYKK